MDGVYLDWNATTPLLPEARAAWLSAHSDTWGNPASIHGHGQAARAALDTAKATIAAHLGIRAHELVLTSGGTEANATVIAGVVSSTGAVAASAIEHSSILRALPSHAQLLPVDSEARIDVAALTTALHPATALVCIQFANNETGTLQPVAALVSAIRHAAPKAWIHLDACQGAGKYPLTLGQLGVDSASFAGHKFGAPKGCGGLYVRSGRVLPPLLRGGRQQQDRRSGSEDAAAAAALAAAFSVHARLGESERQRQRELIELLWQRLVSAVPDVCWLGRGADRMSNTLLLARPGSDAEILVQRLDLRGFSVSRGAACMAGRGEPSHVVRAMGVDPRIAGSALRVSIGSTTTAAELAGFADAWLAESAA